MNVFLAPIVTVEWIKSAGQWAVTIAFRKCEHKRFAQVLAFDLTTADVAEMFNDVGCIEPACSGRQRPSPFDLGARV